MNLVKAKIADFALALFICANSMSWLRLFPQMFPIILLLSCCLVVITKFSEIKTSVVFKVLLFCLFIGLFFLFTYLNDQYYITDDYFQSFCVIGVTGLIIGTQQFEWQRVSKYILLLFLLQINTLMNIKSITAQYEDINGAMMGITYGILPYILCAIYIIFYEQQSRLLRIYAIIVFFICIIFLINYGSRAPQLAIMAFLLYTIYTFIPSGSRKLFIVLSIIVVIVLAEYSEQLLSGNTDVYFLDKMARLEEQGDLSNGRMERYTLAWNGFIESPLLGNGIGNFPKYGGKYPHNVILQILFEGGIIFFIPFFILFYRSFRQVIIKNTDAKIKSYMVFLLCVGFMGLLFSSYFWISQSFWLILGNRLEVKKG